MITSEVRTNLKPRLDASHGAIDLMHTLMRYKAWADADLLNALLTLPEPLREPEAGLVTAIIRHFHAVDCIFKAHLLGVPHEYTSANPPEPATLSQLEQRVSAIDEWYLEYTRNLHQRELGLVLHVTFTDGQQQLLSRADILLHVSLHGSYHRGNVGLLMRKCGVETPQDRFTTYLRTRR
jgi:uncharacterized damage-inducible protein DinB